MTKILATIPGAGLLYVIAVQLTTAVQDMMKVTEGFA